MAWGKEWPVLPNKWYKTTLDKEDTLKIEHVDRVKIYLEEAAPISEKAYNNLKPTHNPYTNPNAQVYYQCDCGAILDPGTKSFAALNNAASEKGWKIRWGHDSYRPFCVKCGEGVE